MAACGGVAWVGWLGVGWLGVGWGRSSEHTTRIIAQICIQAMRFGKKECRFFRNGSQLGTGDANSMQFR